MALTGSERVQRHREKQRARIEELEAENEQLRAALANRRDFCGECANNLVKLFEISDKNDNLQKANKAINTKYRNLLFMKELELIFHLGDAGVELVREYLEENNIDVTNGLTPNVDFDYLQSLDDANLRKWVKIGQRVDKQEGQDAIHTATEWIKGNAPVLANAE